jgi:protein-disulfide isomerase
VLDLDLSLPIFLHTFKSNFLEIKMINLTRLKNTKIILSALIAMFLTTTVGAQTLDKEQIRALVQEEIERLVNTEGALDTAIEKGIATYILKQRLAAENAQAQQQRDRVKNLRPVDAERDHISGNPDAPITLIEYSDFECPFCKRFHPTVMKLMENNQDKLRWVYRHFPLGFHNPGAQKQAEASECVAELNGNDTFWDFSDKIYTRTKSNGKGFPLKNLRPLAEEVGVDGDAFSRCLESGKMTARVKEDIANGSLLGVSGTPAAFIINEKGESRFVAGALPLENLQSLVDELVQ